MKIPSSPMCLMSGGLDGCFYGAIQPFLIGDSEVATACLCPVGKNADTGGPAIFFAASFRRFFGRCFSPYPAPGGTLESGGRNVGGGVGGGQGRGNKTLSDTLMCEWGQNGFA